MPEPTQDLVPRWVRRAFYAFTTITGFALFVLTAAISADLVSGEIALKWVAFLGSLVAMPAGVLGIAYSKEKPDG